MRNKTQIAAAAGVTAWAIFAYAYLGIEDGSSGLSPAGWVHAIFFIPGGLLFQVGKGSHSNADLPLMAVISWLAYTLLALSITQAVGYIRHRKNQELNQQNDGTQ